MLRSLALKGYIRARRRVRAAVTSRPWLDQRLGLAMVKADVLLRRFTPLGSALTQDHIQWRGLSIRGDVASRDIIASLVTNDDYEGETREVIEAALSEGSTFVDLGAHIGFFSLIAARRVGDSGRVYAFEPTPTTRESLERNIAENDLGERITVVPMAISDSPGTAEFLVFGESQRNSLAQPEEVAEDAAQRFEVEVTSLDAYFGALGWPRVDLIKMDIEGAELPALDGMRELVSRNPGVQLIFEYHRAQLERSETDPRVLVDRLVELGFGAFRALFREAIPMDLPREMARLRKMGERSYFNVLCEKK